MQTYNRAEIIKTAETLGIKPGDVWTNKNGGFVWANEQTRRILERAIQQTKN